MGKGSFKRKLAMMGLAVTMSIPNFGTSAGEETIRFDYDHSNDLESFDVETKNNYILQGITNVDDKVLVTAYSENKKENSKVYIFDKDNKLEKEVELYNNAHVGGITYDPNHKIIWITDKSGTISGYTYDSIMKDDKKAEPVFKKIFVGDNLINVWENPAIAYITYHNNSLYLGNYNVKEESYLKKFEIQEDGSINKDEYKQFEFVDMVQGITFYNKDEQDYICVSSSMGRHLKSNIKVFKFDDEYTSYRIKKYIQFNMPSMLEQINYYNDTLYTAYESNCDKYKTRVKQNCDVTKMNLSKTIDEYIKRMK